MRGGTAKLLTLFRPATGEVRAQGVLSAPNAVFHPWLKDHLSQVLAHLEAQPLPVRVPLPADHLLVRTWAHLGALVVVLRTAQAGPGPAADRGLGQPGRAPELGLGPLATPTRHLAALYAPVRLLAH